MHLIPATSKVISLVLIALLHYGCASLNPTSTAGIPFNIPGMEHLNELSSIPGLNDVPELESIGGVPGMGDIPGIPKKIEPPPPLFETAVERTKRLEEKVREMQKQVEFSKDVCAMANAELAILDYLLGESITEKQLTLESPTLVERVRDYAYNTAVETVNGFLGVIQPIIQMKRTLLNEKQQIQEAEIARERNELRRAFVIGQAANHGCKDIQETVSNL